MCVLFPVQIIAGCYPHLSNSTIKDNNMDAYERSIIGKGSIIPSFKFPNDICCDELFNDTFVRVDHPTVKALANGHSESIVVSN
jgi:hypothetical protein